MRHKSTPSTRRTSCTTWCGNHRRPAGRRRTLSVLAPSHRLTSWSDLFDFRARLTMAALGVENDPPPSICDPEREQQKCFRFAIPESVDSR
jgi:hypothetical protein